MRRLAAIRTTVLVGFFGVALVAGVSTSGAVPETADGYLAIPEEIAGQIPDRLGVWNVRYQRIAGGDGKVAAEINAVIDAEARGQVATYEPSATKTKPWTFNSTGTVSFLPLTVSELFVGEYNTDMPNMPFQAVATRVFDKRSGILITWDNLFVDKSAGLARLAEQTKQILPTVYAPPRQGAWQFGNEVAPIDAEFKYWIPTADGVELHFPDYQFGRGLAVITVPWAQLADLIAPEFAAIMS